MTAYLGSGEISRLAEILAELRARRILLVRGRASYRDSGAEAALAPLLAGMQVESFSDFALNPEIGDITRGTKIARLLAPDAVLAVGGGSALDMAKMVACFAAQDADPADLVTGAKPIRLSGPPVIAIPTTAGTGSEATHFAVAYVGHTKYSVAHASLRPAHAIVDPDLTAGLPPYVTATTGLDALCQAIESFWAVAATDDSRDHAAKAIGVLLDAIEPAVLEPTPQARHAMALGAHLAGQAIDVSKTTAPHALSYRLTSRFGIPHGHAVALSLAPCLAFTGRADPGRILHPAGSAFGRRIVAPLCKLLGATTPGGAAARFEALLDRLGVERRFDRLGLASPGAIDEVVRSVNAERLSNHPVALSAAELRELYSGTASPAS